MELRAMYNVVRRWWWIVVTPVVLAAVYLGGTYHPPATSYQVLLRFTAGETPAGLSVDYGRYYVWLSSEYVANGLSDVARTERFAEAVAERAAAAGVRVAPKAIQGAVVSDNSQSMLVVYLTWPDAAQLAVLADAVSAEITQNGAAYYPQLSGLATTAQCVDRSAPYPVAPPLKAQLLGPAVRLLLALALGLGGAFLVHYLDPMVRSAEDVERLSVPVLAHLPRHKDRPQD